LDILTNKEIVMLWYLTKL